MDHQPLLPSMSLDSFLNFVEEPGAPHADAPAKAAMLRQACSVPTTRACPAALATRIASLLMHPCPSGPANQGFRARGHVQFVRFQGGIQCVSPFTPSASGLCLKR